MTKQATREFTDGPLYRLSQAVYRVLGPAGCFLVACLPFAVSVVVGNVIAIALAGITIGPAWSALLYSSRVVLADYERGPMRSFWNGYRLNWRQSLAVWTPYWLLLVVAGIDVTTSVAPTPVRWVVGILAAMSMLWISAVLLLISRYTFRTRDLLRIGVYVLVGAPATTVANAALVVVAGATVYLTSELVLGLLAGIFALFAVRGARSAFALVDSRFTAPATTAASR